MKFAWLFSKRAVRRIILAVRLSIGSFSRPLLTMSRSYGFVSTSRMRMYTGDLNGTLLPRTNMWPPISTCMYAVHGTVRFCLRIGDSVNHWLPSFMQISYRIDIQPSVSSSKAAALPGDQTINLSISIQQDETKAFTRPLQRRSSEQLRSASCRQNLLVVSTPPLFLPVRMHGRSGIQTIH